MENQIYKLQEEEGTSLSFWICDTNDVDPYDVDLYVETKEIVVTFNQGDSDYDFDLSESAARSLIKYLSESLVHITEYNKAMKASKPHKDE
ncbi:hypothetical protein [Flagellimonas flava]|uniref:hypothetical protein n=1 Tax=Flagellimonas flava TaxID=570519 RepID=UPI003D64892E